MCFHTLKNETNNAHKHILITTRYCRGHTPLGNPIDLLSSSLYPYQPCNLQKFRTHSYLHIPFLYGSLYFTFWSYMGNFSTSWPQTAKLGKLGTPTTKITFIQ